MDENHKKNNENAKESKPEEPKDSQACSSPKDIPGAEAARNRNFIAVGSPANVFSSILAGI